ncbi:MAG: competence/damage-inducible protein A [Balneolaceae bacterium]|nr:competence/damage-inducible protein A [Balneolaceae bacterium]MCH8548460.1 competence/damage-inducible protein A [Balneolaceae bacterium]
MRKAHIITIGNELLIGDTVNTNASRIGSILTQQGFYVEQTFTIPDRYEMIISQIRSSMESSSVVIVTGGLGPTHDDITKKAVADLFNVKMREDGAVLEHIREIFRRRNFTFSRSNAEQAQVPENCDVLFNKKGTAPGMWFFENGSALAVLPGVPYEMIHLMEEGVVPKLREVFPGQDVWATRYFKTAGVPESTLSDTIGDLGEFLNNGVEAAYLPSASGVTIRISASGSNSANAAKKLEKISNRLKEKAGELIYAEGREESLASVTGRLLKERKLSVAVAESCTGGLLASTLTDIPGSSDYTEGGIVAYSNRLKTGLLGVSPDDLEQFGAVSKEVVLQMAKGAAERCGAEIGLSTSGIAGPGGGTPDKPVGTVWMGFWFGEENHFALNAVLSKERLINKERTVMIVLETVRKVLLGLDGYPYNLKPFRA